MFGWFKKKEPVLMWTNWYKTDRCINCRHISTNSGKFDEVCPECGKEDIERVTARHEYYISGDFCTGYREVTGKNEVKVE